MISPSQIVQLKDFNTNKEVYPVCAASSAYLDDGSNLNEKMTNIQTALDNINNISSIAYSQKPLIDINHPLPLTIEEGSIS